MKICIYQVTFIAVILSVSKSLHCKHNDHSIDPQQNLLETAQKIKSGINDLVQEAKRTENLHDASSALDYKDKTHSGQRRSGIKRAQNFSSNASNQKDRQIAQTLHYAQKTLEQVQFATKAIDKSNQLTQDSLQSMPTE